MPVNGAFDRCSGIHRAKTVVGAVVSLQNGPGMQRFDVPYPGCATACDIAASFDKPFFWLFLFLQLFILIILGSLKLPLVRNTTVCKLVKALRELPKTIHSTCLLCLPSLARQHYVGIRGMPSKGAKHLSARAIAHMRPIATLSLIYSNLASFTSQRKLVSIAREPACVDDSVFHLV